MIQIDLTAIFTAILTWISRTFAFFNQVQISIFNYHFSLFELFAGGFAVTLFAEFFVMAFIPNADFNQDSGEDWIDEDYDN